jgi:NAD(P)H-hydrate repair Nnr-like enzyme with NAD(P)H-hydrate dehydratase domain
MVDASAAREGHVGYDLHGSGATDVHGLPHLAGRWDAARARALAVESGTTVLVACGLGPTSAGLPHLEAAAALGADQVWLVVDARHKPDDTSVWVDHVLRSVEVDALAVLGAGESRSAHTVNDLGLPVGWKDGEPAPRTVL